MNATWTRGNGLVNIPIPSSIGCASKRQSFPKIEENRHRYSDIPIQQSIPIFIILLFYPNHSNSSKWCFSTTGRDIQQFQWNRVTLLGLNLGLPDGGLVRWVFCPRRRWNHSKLYVSNRTQWRRFWYLESTKSYEISQGAIARAALRWMFLCCFFF